MSICIAHADVDWEIIGLCSSNEVRDENRGKQLR